MFPTRHLAAAACISTSVLCLAGPVGSVQAKGKHWGVQRCVNDFSRWQSTHHHATTAEVRAYLKKQHRAHGCPLAYG